MRPAPPGTPLRPGGPIKHVFFIVRENRTYDQVLGDDPRGDGDPELTLFGKRITPNFHALVQRFPLLDHVYANSEASIDGHFWTSAGAVSDYVHKNWQQNYAGRGRPYDFGVFSITWPGTGFLFDRAQQQGISYYNFGEAVAGHGAADRAGQGQHRRPRPRWWPRSSSTPTSAPRRSGYLTQCYPNDASIGVDAISGALHVRRETYDSALPAGAPLLSESRFSCFQARFRQWLPTNSVPAFTYMVLPSDHTDGLTPGDRSPRAMVAENDAGLAQIVSEISHSSIWRSSAIFVVEDDSQDGADHVDAHRMPAAVISPYAKQGAVVHTRYDMLSVIRSMELILGMRPLSLADATATPMYDAFTPTPANAAPYSQIPPSYPLLERNPNTAANRALTRGYNFHTPDQVPQDVFDQILWRAVHGTKSALRRRRARTRQVGNEASRCRPCGSRGLAGPCRSARWPHGPHRRSAAAWAAPDQARVHHHAREQGLRRDVRRPQPAPYLSQTLPDMGALVPNYYGVTHVSLGNYIALVSGQGSNPLTQTDCQLFLHVIPGTIGAERPGERARLRLSERGADGRRPAHPRRAELEGLHGGHGRGLPPSRDRGPGHDAERSARRRVRGPPQPVRVFPLAA